MKAHHGALALLFSFACTSTNSGGITSSGGTTTSGGVTSSGGTTATGGSTPTGGTAGAAGTTASSPPDAAGFDQAIDLPRADAAKADRGIDGSSTVPPRDAGSADAACPCPGGNCPTLEVLNHVLSTPGGMGGWRPPVPSAVEGAVPFYSMQIGCGLRLVYEPGGTDAGYGYAFDLTTGALVGASIFNDIQFSGCSLFEYRWGDTSLFRMYLQGGMDCPDKVQCTANGDPAVYANWTCPSSSADAGFDQAIDVAQADAQRGGAGGTGGAGGAGGTGGSPRTGGAIAGGTMANGGTTTTGGTTSTGGFLDFCGGMTGLTCPAGQFCDDVASECGTISDTGGHCFATGAAATCVTVSAPICGCDGKSYDNDCLRRAAGVPKASYGSCPAAVANAPGCDLAVATKAIASLGLTAVGTPQMLNVTLPAALPTDDNWGLKATLCQDAGYDIAALAGKTVCLVGQGTTQLCQGAPSDVWVLMNNGEVGCIYKSVRQGVTIAPGVYSATDTSCTQPTIAAGATVMCGFYRSCTSTTGPCCPTPSYIYLFEGKCAPTCDEPSIVTPAIVCDGPEDCGNGQVCCSFESAAAGFRGASCVSATSCVAPSRVICHQQADCPSAHLCGSSAPAYYPTYPSSARLSWHTAFQVCAP